MFSRQQRAKAANPIWLLPMKCVHLRLLFRTSPYKEKKCRVKCEKASQSICRVTRRCWRSGGNITDVALPLACGAFLCDPSSGWGVALRAAVDFQPSLGLCRHADVSGSYLHLLEMTFPSKLPTRLLWTSRADEQYSTTLLESVFLKVYVKICFAHTSDISSGYTRVDNSGWV